MEGYTIITEAVPSANGGGMAKYPWNQLSVGQAFTIPANQLVGKCANYSPNPPLSLMRTGYKIAVRKQPNGDMKVYRVAQNKKV